MAILTIGYNILLFVFGVFFNLFPTATQDAVASVVTGPLCIFLGTCGLTGR